MSQPLYTLANPYPQPGEVLDAKYRVERLLGEGGMGAVAKATHLLRRAPVALKFMSPAVLAMPGAVERFVNEGVAASQIDSDHVVKVYDVGRMPTGAPYLVMEYLDGQDLGQLLLQEGGRLDPWRAVHFALQILRALQTAHASGIIHRDMKPSNCFVIDKDGEPDFVKLVDFGISKVRSDDEAGRSANLTRTNSALGTPLYMSPEQARSPRDVDMRADLYSVGAIVYELLTGRTPYTAESGEYTEILFKIFTTDPEPLQGFRPDVPDGLAAVVHHALVRDRDARFASASEMAEALAPFADDRSATVLTRLRGARPRSSVVSPSVSVGTPPPVATAQLAVAPANTYPQGTDAARAPAVPADVGVARDAALTPATQPAAKTSLAPLAVALGAVLILCTAAGVVVLRRAASGPTMPATHDTVAPTRAADPPPPPAPSIAPAATAATILEPLPSPTVSVPSSTASAAPTAPTQAPAPASAKPKPPTNLVGVQPHF
jgi:eukaryotic-like serine/threonine-protein kinase